MKKIFAIALALVMVLSMASAFASYCTGSFDWTCATTTNKCGKATVEVVPYVATNSACNEVTYVANDCAAAINGENVYYVLKLTVDKDVDPEWWAEVEVELTAKGVTLDKGAAWKLAKGAINLKNYEDKSKDGWVFYFNNNMNWAEATEDKDFDIQKWVNKAVVTEYAKAKVCLTLTSEDAGWDGIVGDYYVEYKEKVDAVEAKAATKAVISATYTQAQYDTAVTNGWLTLTDWTMVSANADIAAGTVVVTWEKNKDGVIKEKDVPTNAGGVAPVLVKNGTAPVKAVAGVVNALKVYTVKNAGKGDLLVTYIINDGKITDIQYTAVCGAANYATVKGFFGLEIGTCVDKDLIKANFGWEDKVESCYAWKTQNAVAIVDAECVVAIPKTGDASVLAWLF